MSPSPKFTLEGGALTRFPSNVETLRVVVQQTGTVTLEHRYNQTVTHIDMFASDAEALALELTQAADIARGTLLER
jgi:hypothetical protein